MSNGFCVLQRQVSEDLELDFSHMTQGDLEALISGKERITIRMAAIRGDKARLATRAPRSVGIIRPEIEARGAGKAEG